MKKAVLVLFAASLLFILTGFTITAATGFNPAGFRASSGKFEKLDRSEPVSQTAAAADCSSVELRLVNTRLQVRAAEDGSDRVKLEYENIYRDEWSYSFDGGVMKLQNKKYNSWFDGIRSFSDFIGRLREGNFNFDFDWDGKDDLTDSLTHTVTLTIPKEKSLQLSFSDVNGSMKLEGIKARKLTLNNVNCGIEADGLTVEDEIRVSAVNGSVTMKDAKAAKLTFTTAVNGQCTLTSPQFEKISGSFVNNSLRLGGVNPDDYSISYNLVNGSVKAGSDTYSGNGNTGSGAKYSISFKGVNSSLYLSSDSK